MTASRVIEGSSVILLLVVLITLCSFSSQNKVSATKRLEQPLNLNILTDMLVDKEFRPFNDRDFYPINVANHDCQPPTSETKSQQDFFSLYSIYNIAKPGKGTSKDWRYLISRINEEKAKFDYDDFISVSVDQDLIELPNKKIIVGKSLSWFYRRSDGGVIKAKAVFDEQDICISAYLFYKKPTSNQFDLIDYKSL